MALLENRRKKYVSKKVNIEENLNKEIALYAEFWGLDTKKDTNIENDIINQCLEYVFDKDKDFKSFKENKTKENVVNINENDSEEINKNETQNQ